MAFYALRFKKTPVAILSTFSKYDQSVVEKYVGKLVGFSAVSNGDAEFSVSVAFELDGSSPSIWVTTSKSVAERVAANSTKWYNAGSESPINPYVGALEVVELKVN